MTNITWLALAAILAALAYSIWRARDRWVERQRAAEQRLASFAAQALPQAKAQASPPVPAAAGDPAALSQQKLLFEAAAKAGEAGEPVLCIQLYARLLARYPDTAFGGQARAAVEAQKKRLAAKR